MPRALAVLAASSFSAELILPCLTRMSAKSRRGVLAMEMVLDDWLWKCEAIGRDRVRRVHCSSYQRLTALQGRRGIRRQPSPPPEIPPIALDRSPPSRRQ